MPTPRGIGSLGLLTMALVLASCMADETGRLSALGTGALLPTPAPRLEVVEAPCGAPAAYDASLRRLPYLQSVTSTGGVVVWTATSASRLSLTTPDGAPVETMEPAVEPTIYLAEGEQYVARMRDLEPATVYCYSLVGDDGRALFGPEALRTAPAPDSTERIDIVVFGDSGGATPDQIALAAQLETVPADLMLHTGDVAYYDGTIEQLEETYFDIYAPMIARTPMFPTSGNHDYHTDDAGPFREVFVLPEAGASEPERWYSFDWGPVHVVALDNERDGEEQRAWLARDLAANTQPWTIVVTHKGPYSAGAHGDSRAFRDLYQPLLEEHGVQLVLSGHDHHYERLHPVRGVTYVVTGGGGYSTRAPGVGEHTAFAEGVTHFVYVAIEGDTMSVHAIDAMGREFDGALITR